MRCAYRTTQWTQCVQDANTEVTYRDGKKVGYCRSHALRNMAIDTDAISMQQNFTATSDILRELQEIRSKLN